MIIKINGAPIKERENIMEPKVIRNRSGINKMMKMATGTKWLMGIAAATMFMDFLFGGGAVTAMAATSLSGAFEPVKILLLDVADPICYIMFVWGCIECICMRPASGLNRMKYAAIGYIAINWIPVVMTAIRSAGPGA
jgi:hypothetical protein